MRVALIPKAWTFVPSLNQPSDGEPSAFSTRAVAS